MKWGELGNRSFFGNLKMAEIDTMDLLKVLD
jgi:hypothetical protein